MTYEDFDKLLEKMFEEERGIGKTKAREYTVGDRLDNFKRLGKELGLDPKAILWVYCRKHIDSIANYLRTGASLSEPIESRIMDARVYLSLLRGLIEEERCQKSSG